MTYARWKTDGFDAKFVSSKVAEGITATPNGVLQFSAEVLFDDPLVLLESGIEFLVPVSDSDRHRIIRGALVPSLLSKNYGPKVLIGEINKAARDFVNSPETEYVVATGLSFGHFEDLSRVEASGCRIYVRRRFPQHLVRDRKEAEIRSKRTIGGNYPRGMTSQSYAAAWVHVKGRSEPEAMDQAVEALDLRRGIWNFALNRSRGGPFPPPSRGPTNEVLAGPLFSLHHRDGSLATEYDWHDPEYTGPRVSKKAARDWDRVREDEGGIRAALKASPYRAILEDCLRRYCRALDATDLQRSFLELWGLLETLTGIGPDDGHEKVVRRASFIFAGEQRKTHEQVLYHLRRHRNTYVHVGEGSDEVGAYMHQARTYAEQLLLFHLRSSQDFSSLAEAARFLDLPPEASDLEHMIGTFERDAERATESARLAERGLRFHQGR